MLSYLSKIPDVEEVEGLEQLALLHAEDLAARCQESPDILQAQELCGEDRKGSTVSEAPRNVQAPRHAQTSPCVIISHFHFQRAVCSFFFF